MNQVTPAGPRFESVANTGGGIGRVEPTQAGAADGGLAHCRHVGQRTARQRAEHRDEHSPVGRHGQADVGRLAQSRQGPGQRKREEIGDSHGDPIASCHRYGLEKPIDAHVSAD